MSAGDADLLLRVGGIAGSRSENNIGDANQADAGRFFPGAGWQRPRAGGGHRGKRTVSRILIVARNTFREAVPRSRAIQPGIFALLMIASAVIVGQISMDIETIVMVSLGLSAISLIGLLIAVFTGVGLVAKEIDKTNAARGSGEATEAVGVFAGKLPGWCSPLTVNTASDGCGAFFWPCGS